MFHEHEVKLGQRVDVLVAPVQEVLPLTAQHLKMQYLIYVHPVKHTYIIKLNIHAIHYSIQQQI